MCGRMKSNAVCFITSGIAACCLCLCAEVAGAKTNVVEKTVAASAAKVDDAAKAAEEAKSAAEQGLPKAQFYLGCAYYSGDGVATNKQEAVLNSEENQMIPSNLLSTDKLYSTSQVDILSIASILIALTSLVITCYEFYQISRKNAYDRKVKDIQAIQKPFCRLIKKNLYLDEMCEKCLAVGGWRQMSVRITGFMNTPAYEDLLHDLNNILYDEMLNVLVFSHETRSEIRRLITHIEELDGLVVIVTDPETFKPREIRKQICHIKEGWLRLTKSFAKDLMLNMKEKREFCDATAQYVNCMVA